MTWIKNRIDNLKEQLRIVVTKPDNFEVKWTITSSKIQIFSFIFLIVIILGILFSLLLTKGPFSGYVAKNDVSIERQKLISQSLEIKKLASKLDYQELYISNIKKVLNGEIIADSFNSEIPETQQVIIPKFDGKLTDNEKEIEKKVKNDMQTSSQPTIKKSKKLTYFSSPVKGVVIANYDLENHPFIEVKTVKDMIIKACLAGTVIYAGYTSKDGYMLIIEHPNDYISIYKHAKIALKKIGAKVQTGDPIGIVGKNGSSSFEPHLWFELWYNQNSLNPIDYISFK
jgi:murein DD-endopeptidase MepM/ murein hydrolase activator NlpD